MAGGLAEPPPLLLCSINPGQENEEDSGSFEQTLRREHIWTREAGRPEGLWAKKLGSPDGG